MGNNSYYTGGWDANEYSFQYGNGASETRKTYKAKNTKNGEILATVIAEDALEFINPDEVKTAIQNLVEVFKNECADLEGLLMDPSPDGKIDTALVIDGLSMRPRVEEEAHHIHFLPDSFVSTFYKTYSSAVEVFNNKQKEYNKKAKQEAEKEGNAAAQAKQNNNPDYKYHIKVIEG